MERLDARLGVPFLQASAMILIMGFVRGGRHEYPKREAGFRLGLHPVPLRGRRPVSCLWNGILPADGRPGERKIANV
jgi:hypothetical protein